MKLDDLRRTLAANEAQPRVGFTGRLVLAAALGGAGSCAVLLATMGLRPDFAEAFLFWHAPLKFRVRGRVVLHDAGLPMEAP